MKWLVSGWLLAGACAPAVAASDHDSPAGDASHATAPDYSYPTVGLPIPPNANDAERLQVMSQVFERRRYRLDWKSDSVVKRIEWALEDARAAAGRDPEVVAKRLDDAQRLLERW
jgi:hypothetical protein